MFDPKIGWVTVQVIFCPRPENLRKIFWPLLFFILIWKTVKKFEFHKWKTRTHSHCCSWLFLKHQYDLSCLLLNDLSQAINQHVYIEMGRQSVSQRRLWLVETCFWRSPGINWIFCLWRFRGPTWDLLSVSYILALPLTQSGNPWPWESSQIYEDPL